jgi:hypothetical protein
MCINSPKVGAHVKCKAYQRRWEIVLGLNQGSPPIYHVWRREQFQKQRNSRPPRSRRVLSGVILPQTFARSRPTGWVTQMQGSIREVRRDCDHLCLEGYNNGH